MNEGRDDAREKFIAMARRLREIGVNVTSEFKDRLKSRQHNGKDVGEITDWCWMQTQDCTPDAEFVIETITGCLKTDPSLSAELDLDLVLSHPSPGVLLCEVRDNAGEPDAPLMALLVKHSHREANA